MLLGEVDEMYSKFRGEVRLIRYENKGGGNVSTSFPFYQRFLSSFLFFFITTPETFMNNSTRTGKIHLSRKTEPHSKPIKLD